MTFFSRLSLLALVAAFSSAGTACYMGKKRNGGSKENTNPSDTKRTADAGGFGGSRVASGNPDSSFSL